MTIRSNVDVRVGAAYIDHINVVLQQTEIEHEYVSVCQGSYTLIGLLLEAMKIVLVI